MVNVRTLRGLYAALLECVPGKAQRSRLLEALARVSGNRGVSEAITWLRARDDEAAQARGERRVPVPPKSGVFRTQLITYTQSPPEVQVTMSKGTAEALLRALEDASYDSDGTTETGRDPTAQELRRALDLALGGKRASG